MSRPAVIFDQVSKVYSLSHQKTENLKDRLTRMLRGGKAPVQTQAETEAFYALRDVSFEIQPGESVGIIGPNGSGKSTSLKILAGVTQPSSGRFELNGRLGALIEVGAGFHPEMTGRENVYMNGSILGMSKKEIDRQFDSIVDFSEIEQFIDTPVKHYSSGMYVRLGFAVAIHNEPEVMLVDEVLAVGDLAFQKKCIERMEGLKRDGRTFILVSHSMAQIQSTCDRAIYLKNGGLIFDGAAHEAADMYLDASESRKTQKREVEKISGHSIEVTEECGTVTIEDIRLIDNTGTSLGHALTGRPMKFEVEYQINGTIIDPTVVLVIKRNGIRIYSSNTRILDVALGDLSGRGSIECVIPALPLLPNDFDVEVWFFDKQQKNMLAKTAVKNLFSVSMPKDTLFFGCVLPVETAERGIVYAKAAWAATRN